MQAALPFPAVDRTAPPMHAALSSCRHRESSSPDLARCATRVGLAPPDHSPVPMHRSHACKQKLHSVSVSSLLHPSPGAMPRMCSCPLRLTALALCPLSLCPAPSNVLCPLTTPNQVASTWSQRVIIGVGQAMPRVGSCPLRSLCPLSLCPAHSAPGCTAVDALVMTLHHNTLHDISACPAPTTSLLLSTV